MDEEDSVFLQSFNAQFRNTQGADNAAEHTRSLRSPRRDKGKEPERPPDGLSEDDFETLMSRYEAYADEYYPALHVVRSSLRSCADAESDSQDLARLPPENEMESCLTSDPTASLARLRPFARVVYAHWKERRLKRDGKTIIPQLDVRWPRLRSGPSR